MPIKQLKNLKDGVISLVDDELAEGINAIRFSMNLLYHKKTGRAQVRPGTALVGSQIADGKKILGLHQFILASGTKHLLAVVTGAANSALYRLIEGTWTTESVAGVKDVKHRFLTFQDVVLVVDGTNKTSSVNGDTWITTGGAFDLGNMSAFKYIIEWKDRVYGVTANSDTLEYSGLSSGTAISWTSGNGSIRIEPYDGQGTITGLGKVPGYLLIFKERALKRWSGASTFPDDLAFFGTSSQESVVLGGKTCFYFSTGNGILESIGFYETNGEQIRKISRNIQEVVNAIPTANYADIAGYGTSEICRWNIGDGIIIDGITYNNVEVVYHIPTQTWAVLSYPTEHKVYSLYVNGTAITTVCGDDDGQILTLDTGTTDEYTT